MSFSPPAYYNTAAGPFNLVTADLRNNKILDLITANSDSNSISVLLGNGDGTFEPARNFATSIHPVRIAVGDFNGDGIPDIITANNSSSDLSVLLGNGDGTFRAPINTPTDRNPEGLAVGDFNGDGILDVVVTGSVSNTVDIHLGNGDGTFRPRVSYPGGQNSQAVVVADFNGDGVLDFALADNYEHSIRRYLGNGDGTFQPGVNYPVTSVVDMIVGDFNNDGFPDIVASDYSFSQLSVALNDGHGAFPTLSAANAGGNVRGFAAGDFDGDGRLDLVAPHWLDNTVGILRGNGDGTFQTAVNYQVGQSSFTSPIAAAVGDFDGDSYPDIAVANNRTNQVAVLLDRPNAVRLQVSTPVNPVAGSAFTMTIAALDAGGTVASNFRGTVHVTATDPAASLPADYTFTAADRGVKTFSATFRTAGSQTLTAIDTHAREIMGSTTLMVSPAAASSLIVAGFSSPVTAGQAGSITVTARDLYGNTATGYRGTVHFSSTDSQASLPSNYTFTSGDNGAHAFSVTLKTAGSRSITAADLSTGSLTGTQAGILVNPAAASQLQLGAPATVAPRATFPLGVRALDPYNNVATGYRGTLHFIISDPRALPLPDYTFTAADAGVQQFLANLITVGTQTITAQDQANRISGSANVAVALAPIFASAINLNAGARPRAVATGDFNGDGIEDLVVANESGNNITVILGLGDGTFLNGVNYPVGPAPTSIVAADFNGDGILDLAVTDNGGNTVSLLLGNGDGSFQKARNLTVDSGPISIAAADVNGDGLLDLAVANKNSSTVSVLLGNGDGTFQPAQNFPVDSNPWSVAVGDLNGDGVPDLVTANDALSVSLLLGRGDGTFRPAVNLAAGGASPRAVAVADVNGDGILDLVTANYNSNTVSVYPGLGDGTFRTAVNYDVQSGPQSMLVADVNGDGFPDIVTADQGGVGVGVMVNRGDGTFQPAVYYRAGSLPLGLALDDFNGDAAPDLAVANGDSINVSILFNLAPATSLTVTAPASRVADTPFSVTVTVENAFGGLATGYRGTVHFTSTDPAATLPADYTFTTADAGVHTFPVTLHTLGNQTITVQDTATGALMGSATVAVINPSLFYPAVNYPIGRGPASVAVGDVNGDGIPDLITASAQDGSIGVLLGQGNGSFGSARFYPAGAGAGGVMVGDFNGDGRLDVVVSHGYSSPTISVLFGNGDGSFRAPVDYPAGGYTSEIAVGDLNGDGILDLVVGHTADSTVGVLLGKPDGTFLPVVNYVTGTFSRAAVIADFNGDGIPDLAAVDQGADSVSILQGNGDGTFRPAVNYAVGSAPTSLAVGDFNGDGALDLVTVNFTFGGSVGTVSVLLNQGDGTFRPARNYNVGQNPHSVAVGDFDGDGILDLAVANNGSGTVSILLGNGDGSFQSLTTLSVGQSPFSVVAADLNDDGFPDLAVANGGSNSVSVLLNTGGQSGSPGVGSRTPLPRVMPDPERTSWVGVAPALPTTPRPVGASSIGGAAIPRISREDEHMDWAFATLGSSSTPIAWRSSAARLPLRGHARSGELTSLSFDLEDLAGAVEPLPWELD